MARRRRRLSFSNMLPEVESGTKRGIIIVFVFLLAVLSLLSIFDLAGGFGQFFYAVLKLVFGWGFWIFPLVLLVVGYLSLNTSRHSFETINWIGMFLLIIGYSGFFHLTQDPLKFKEILSQGVGGGYIGMGIAWPLYKIMGRWAAMIVSIALFLVGVLLMFNTSLESLIDKITFRSIRHKVGELTDKFRARDRDVDYEEEGGQTREPVEFEERELEDKEAEAEEVDELDEGEEDLPEQKKKIKRKYPRIDLPLSLLSNASGKPSAGDIKFNQEIVRKTLQNFGIQVEMGEVSVGPTVTQYTFRPAEGVKLSRIIGLSSDLALALAAHPIRIEAPIPGKSLVGVEVPNKKVAVVSLRQVLESDVFKQSKSSLNIALGQDVAGMPWVVNLSRLPHLLVAGATNSGKTVCLNSIIVSLLYQNQPDELKFILVDPKRVEMPVFNGIPHLLTPVITEVKKTINALKWTTSEMERRFHVLSNAGKRNIQSYNITHPRDRLPYLVFIIDELADLMAVASVEVESAIIRLAQMSRAVGIHLILATQRPSVDILTGLIKANIPGRIAFAVTSLTDSRTILDVSGAEKLLGRGDMLFISPEVTKPKRLQGAYSSDEDIENVVKFLRQRAEPDYEEEVVEKVQGLALDGRVLSNLDDEDGDELLEEARELVIKAGKASASYLQRRLRIGYARAARILDLLEERGVIGPADGSKPREVLIRKGEKSLVEQADEIIQADKRQAGSNIPRDIEEEETAYVEDSEDDKEDIQDEVDEDELQESSYTEVSGDKEEDEEEEDEEEKGEEEKGEEEKGEAEDEEKYKF